MFTEDLKKLSRGSLLILLLAALLPLPAVMASSGPVRAAEFGYQGTHILTHGALSELAVVFAEKYGIKMPVRGGGCADGMAVVINDRFELGGICCPLPPPIMEQYGLVAHPVALDIKTVIVHPANPVADLTLEQVAAMHQGRLRHWREAGVDFNYRERPVAVVFRDHCRDMDEPVRRLLGLDAADAPDGRPTGSGRTIVVNTDQEIVDYVAELPTAIGVVSQIFAVNSPVRIINVNGVEPTPAAVEAGAYPLVAPLYIVTTDPPSPQARKFLEFVRSSEGQAIIGRTFGRIQ